MLEAVFYLTGIAVILLAGILSTLIAKKLGVSHVLILLIVGLMGGHLFSDLKIFQFSDQFSVAVAVLALVMIVFDGTSKLKLREVDKASSNALEHTVVLLLVNLLVIGSLATFLFTSFTLKGVLMAVIFSIIITGTDPSSVFTLLGKKSHKTLSFLKIESVFNTPLIVVLPILVAEMIQNLSELTILSGFTDLVTPLVRQVIVGIGAGVTIGIILLKFMKDKYSKKLSPLAMLTAALLSYILAENMGGSGVLGVASLGVLFGSFYLKKKRTLQDFSSVFSFVLETLVFVLIGFVVSIDWSLSFVLLSVMVFLASLLCRYFSLNLTFRDGAGFREKVFMALNSPKGVAVAVVVLSFKLLSLPFLDPLLDLAVVFIIYSLIVSSLTDHFSKYFIDVVVEEEE